MPFTADDFKAKCRNWINIWRFGSEVTGTEAWPNSASARGESRSELVSNVLDDLVSNLANESPQAVGKVAARIVGHRLPITINCFANPTKSCQLV